MYIKYYLMVVIKPRAVASKTLNKVKKAIGLDYRNAKDLIDSQRKKYNNEK